jgi:hypothetical protein
MPTDKTAQEVAGTAPAPVTTPIAETPLPEPEQADLAPLRQVLATKTIPREVGTDIAPGQLVWLPKEIAAAEIKAGRATDPGKAKGGA